MDERDRTITDRKAVLLNQRDRDILIDALNDAAENVVNASEALGEGHDLEDDLRDDVEQIDALIIALGGEPQDRGL